MNYPDYSNTDLLQDYGAARRELAQTLADIRELKRELDERESLMLLEIGGKNAEERKGNLTKALGLDEHTRNLRQLLTHAERRKDEMEAEVDVIAKFIQSQQWSIRLRQVEALERLGREDSLTDALHEQASDHMSGGSLESSHFANQRRLQPTFTTADDDQIPF